MPKPTLSFDDDLAYLKAHGPIEVLASPGGGRVAVSPGYQGRVMTSAIAPGGESLGFVHRTFIDSGKTGTAFDNFGGEDRFWLGPEAGQFGLYFAPGKPFSFDEWQTPHQMQEGAWTVAARDDASITFERRMRVQNHSYTEFLVDVRRTVRLLSDADVTAHLGVTWSPPVAWVAYESQNRITNSGSRPWTEATGLVSVWILGMFAPAPDARIVIPFDAAASGPVVNDRYFGAVPADRLTVHEKEGWLVFSADGQRRSKIGLGPARARGVAASYSPSKHLLTIVQYDAPPPAAAAAPAGKKSAANRYVNSMWEQQADPYAGDVINAYNDGPTAPGKPSLGGFYELETSSPGAALAPGASLTHVHRTVHFVGEASALDAIARKVLGVGIKEIGG
jgi:hypothetical protein